MAHIIVLGAGVIGLQTSLGLLKEKYRVTFVSSHWPASDSRPLLHIDALGRPVAVQPGCRRRRSAIVGSCHARALEGADRGPPSAGD
ncbi:hypothetical protein V2G26_007489 [Clonostachys chloroleuca]